MGAISSEELRIRAALKWHDDARKALEGKLPVETRVALVDLRDALDRATEIGDADSVELIAGQIRDALEQIKKPKNSNPSARAPALDHGKPRAGGPHSAPEELATPDSRLAPDEAHEVATLPAAEPDRKEASRFIGALIQADEPGEQYTYQTFDDSEKKRPDLARIYHGKGNAPELARLNTAGAGIYLTISATDGRGRREGNVRRVRAVFVDADKDGAAVLAAIRSAGLAPHIVDESSPGKYHIYWLVKRDFPMDQFTVVQAALAAKFGTDPKVKDLSRVMRLPGFYHMKDPAHPFKVRILELADRAPYSLDQIVAGLGLELKPAAAPERATQPAPKRDADVVDPNTERARLECEMAIAETAEAAEGDRNDALLKFVYLLRERASANPELCMEYGLRFAREKCSPPYSESEARATIRSAVRSARNPAGSRSEIDDVRHAATAQDFEDLGPAEKTDNPFAAETAAEFASRPPPEHIMDDVIPRAELAVMFGESGSGKSFLALDLAGAIARGVPWRTQGVKGKGRVAYIAAEGAGGFRNRLVAYMAHHAIAPESFDVIVIPHAPNFGQKADVAHVIAAIKAHWATVDVVMVDTWAQVTPGADENSGADMGLALRYCRAIHRATGALILLIAHAGKDLSKGIRGWSGLRAAAEAEIEVTRNGDARCATVTKLKDGNDGVKYPFRLNVVAIGERADGKSITSCVVEHITEEQTPKGRREPQGKNARLVWRVVNELVGLGDEEVEIVRVIDAASIQIPHDPAKKNDRRREYVRDALERLADTGFVEIDDLVVRVRR